MGVNDLGKTVFEDLYGHWSRRTPDDVAQLFRGYPGTWWIAGGWALEAFTGHGRSHDDIDPSVLRSELPLMRKHPATTQMAPPMTSYPKAAARSGLGGARPTHGSTTYFSRPAHLRSGSTSATSRSGCPWPKPSELRPVTAADVEELIDLNADPSVMTYIRGRAASRSPT